MVPALDFPITLLFIVSLPLLLREKVKGRIFFFAPSHGERVFLTVPHGITFTHHRNVCSHPTCPQMSGGNLPQ